MSSPATTLLAGQYFLAVHGLALMRALFTDTSAAQACTEGIRTIASQLDEHPNSLAIDLAALDVEEGYTRWAESYDGPNPAVEAEEPVVHGLLADLPIGVALDAACGTGRHAAELARLGHRVIGVDSTEAMLEVARTRLPDADLRLGRLDALPVDDASVDVVTCALALTHVAELTPVMVELARVLRPGGTAILSDMHPVTTALGSSPAGFRDDAVPRGIAYVANRSHQISDYLGAFRAAGLAIDDCLEPTFGPAQLERLMSFRLYPEVSRQAFEGVPFVLIWRLHRP
jgi:ubiquinone/menaquinone biosynthesis C-methylase UbiE